MKAPKSDQDRADRATRDGDTMLGPLERYRCPDHPRNWVTYRWSWPVPADGDHLAAIQSNSDAEIVRECAKCNEEAEAGDAFRGGL